MLTFLLCIFMFVLFVTTSYLRDDSREHDAGEDQSAQEVKTFCTVATVVLLVLLPVGWVSAAFWVAGLVLLDWSHGSNSLNLIPHTI